MITTRKSYLFTKGRKKAEITAIDNDDWFYKVTQGGKKPDNGLIIKKDLQIWIDKFIRNGFSMTEKDI